MSDTNVELTRRLAGAYNAQDIETFIAACDPSVEFHAAIGAVGGVYRGHDGFYRDIADAWGDENSLEPEAYFDLGERTLAFYVLHARGRQSGAEVATPIAHLLTWREGLVVYGKSYIHREDALGDLGVSEDELEPIEP